MVADKYGLKLHYCSLKPKDILKQIDKILFHQDYHLLILVLWPNFYNEISKSNGINFILDGQVGDELLYGYRKYFNFYLKDLLKEKNFYPLLRNCFIY